MAGLRQSATGKKIGIMAPVRLLSGGSETQIKENAVKTRGYRANAPSCVSSPLYACMHCGMRGYNVICAGK